MSVTLDETDRGIESRKSRLTGWRAEAGYAEEMKLVLVVVVVVVADPLRELRCPDMQTSPSEKDCSPVCLVSGGSSRVPDNDGIWTLP
jgi:hypothetical protein